MKSILVCVDYHDYLAITLPRNRHHFSEVMVVTTERDKETQRVANQNDCIVFTTDSFYANGAHFNKFRAMEEGLDQLGRTGWIAIMDADVIWPYHVPFDYQHGFLYTPHRRMMKDQLYQGVDGQIVVPDEPTWKQFPLHGNTCEWAGYTQIFNANDPVLGPAPWHDTKWAHAGGGDSFFQFKWQPGNKIRPNWEVLHLGENGRNWCGRSTPLLTGEKLPEADQRANQLQHYMNQRRGRRPGDFAHEKLQ